MRQLLVATALAASLSGCCTAIGGVAGYHIGSSRAHSLEVAGDPVPEHLASDDAIAGALVGLALDALVLYKMAHAFDGQCLGYSGGCAGTYSD